MSERDKASRAGSYCNVIDVSVNHIQAYQAVYPRVATESDSGDKARPVSRDYVTQPI